MRLSDVVLRTPLVLPVLWLALLAAIPSRGQNEYGQVLPHDCTAADLDVGIRTASTPDHGYLLTLTFRNLSDWPCAMSAAVPQPNFNAGGAPLVLPFGTCFNCSPDGTAQPADPIALYPGAAARQEFRWGTTPPGPGIICPAPEWMNTAVNQDGAHPVLLVSRKLLPPVCTMLQISPYLSGPGAADDGTAAASSRLKLHLTSAKPAYAEENDLLEDRPAAFGERIVLHLAIDAGALAPAEPAACPVVLQKTRSPGGTTRFDEAEPGEACRAVDSSAAPAERRFDWQLDAGHLSRWSGFGGHSIAFFALEPAPGGRWQLGESSNSLLLVIIDGATLERRWGPQEKGVAVSLTLDKETFAPGEHVALHLALRNFSAEKPVYSYSPVWRPWSLVRIDVYDAQGTPVKATLGKAADLVPQVEGGPAGLWRYPLGATIAFEMSLENYGLVPDRPGKYTVVATWSPYSGSDDTCTLCELPPDFDFDHHYAVARSQPAAFRIVDKPE